MITRVALFLTLLAVFYFYCKEDSNSNQFRGPNDINMIEIPAEIYPSFMENTNTDLSDLADSIYFLSREYTMTEQPSLDFKTLNAKNY